MQSVNRLSSGRTNMGPTDAKSGLARIFTESGVYNGSQGEIHSFFGRDLPDRKCGE